MMKPLPAVFAMCCVRDRWLAVSPSGRPHDRRFDRQELRAGDLGGLGSGLGNHVGFDQIELDGTTAQDANIAPA
jgi:hypothetical protein